MKLKEDEKRDADGFAARTGIQERGYCMKKSFLRLLLALGLVLLLLATAAQAGADGAYTVTVATDIPNGTVEADVETADEGATVTLTATPAEGYGLYRYVVTDAEDAAVEVTGNTFVMPASNVNVSAVFKKAMTGIPVFYDRGTAGANSSEGADALMDLNTSTKWCVTRFSSAYVEFHTETPIVITGYVLTTGNDNSRYPGRNPKDWTIKGKLNADDDWTTIAAVENDTVLKDENNKSYTFEVSTEALFRYFRFDVTAIQNTNNENTLQLSELGLNGIVDDADLSYATITGVEDRYLFTGSPIKPVPTVKDVSGVTLTEGTHYEVVYGEDCVQDGTYELTVRAIEGGGYTGYKTITYRIYKIELESSMVTGVERMYAATGSEIKPVPVVKDKDGKALTLNTDYTLEYVANSSGGDFINPGEYAVVVKAPETSKYKGSVWKYYRIYEGVTASYVDAAGKSYTRNDFCVVTEDELENGLLEGWYLVNEDVEYDGTIYLNGDVKLVVADGKKLTVDSYSYGFEESWYGNDGTLTVYGQTARSGQVNVKGRYGISAYGFTLESAVVNVDAVNDDDWGESCGIRIYKNDLVVKGGKLNVTSESRYAEGIIVIGGRFILEGGEVNVESNGGYYAYGVESISMDGYFYMYMNMSPEEQSTRSAALDKFRGGEEIEEEAYGPAGVVISGGTLNAKATGEYNNTYAISVRGGSVEISGGKVNAEASGEGMTGAILAHQIPNGAMPIGLTGTRAITISDESEPVLIKISGGEVTAKATSDEFMARAFAMVRESGSMPIGGRAAAANDPESGILITGGKVTAEANGAFLSLAMFTSNYGDYGYVDSVGPALSTRALRAEPDEEPGPDIRITDGEVTVTANAGYSAVAIASTGEVIISGGKINAAAKLVEMSPEMPLEPTGRRDVEEEEDFFAAEAIAAAGGNVTISGGQITATAEAETEDAAAGIDAIYGDVSLGWTKPTDFILATRYHGETVSVVDGKTFGDGKNLYTGELNEDDLEKAEGQKLVPAFKITVQKATNGTVKADREVAIEGQTVTLTLKPDAGCALASLTVKCGNKTVSVSGSGNTYTFKAPAGDVVVTATFSPTNYVVAFNKSDVKFIGTTPYVIANGKAQKPRFTVTVNGKTVPAASYTYEYKENVKPGTAYLFITFKNGYSGSCRAFFKIYLPPTATTTIENTETGIVLKWSPVDGAAGYVIYRRTWNLIDKGWTTFERWNNTTKTTWTDTKVYAGTRYQYGIKAYFAKRTDPITGVSMGGAVGDNYNLGVVGPLVTTVRITTRKINSVTPGSGKMTVKWSGSKVFTGYQLQYARDAAFTKNVKEMWISDPATYEKTIRALTSGATYYVRIRSYHTFEGMNYFGQWSNVVSCKVK